MKIAIIGAGAMGGAMTDGFIKSGAVKPADISVANPTAKKLEHFALQGASVTTDNKTAADGADIVIIAVKPWLVEQVVNELKPVLNYTRQTVITVAAGISGSQFTAWLKKDDELSAVNTPQTFIVIPNTAIAVLHLSPRRAFCSPCLCRAKGGKSTRAPPYSLFL